MSCLMYHSGRHSRRQPLPLTEPFQHQQRGESTDLVRECVMGFEHFRVELRGGRTTYAEAVETIRRLPHIKPDHDSIPLPRSTYFLMDSGTHVIELELMDAPVYVSCRFTL